MKNRIPILVIALFFGWCAACAAAEIKVEITAVQEDNKAAINQGKAAGVAPGMVFNILGEDGQKVVGTLTVLDVGDDQASGIYYMNGEGPDAPAAGMQAVFGTADEGASAGAEIIVQKGSVVEIILDSDIGSQTSKVGDVVSFTVKVPVVWNGIEVIPQGSKAFGEITEAKPAKGYGKSGKLDFSIKFVQAVDGTNVPISFEMENKKGNNYMKAALGTYVTGFLGGGAMKGKKVIISKGTEFKVFTAEDTKLRGASASGAGTANAGLVMREKRTPGDIKIAFLGLHDSYNTAEDPGAGYNADKISTFVSYKMMWDSGFDFVNPLAVMDKVSNGFDGYFIKKGDASVAAAERYDVAKIAELGAGLDADYVIVGDILSYVTTETKKTDVGRAAVNLLSIAGGGATMDSTRKVFEFKAMIDMAIVDVKSGEIFWNEKCEGEHKASKLLERKDLVIPVMKIKGSYYGLAKDINYDYSQTSDPIALAGTEEGTAVLKTLNPFLLELPNLF